MRDRGAILVRRAALLQATLALASLGCPPKTYGKSVQLMRAWHERRRAQIVERIDAQLKAPGAVERWNQLQDLTRRANPRPCLSFACWE